jgi:CO/xanthine dehydrogenase FAD-binding subunit
LHEFSYHAPTSLAEAIGLLATHGAKARLLCGGTDLIIQMRAGVHRPQHIIDAKQIQRLRQLNFDPADGLFLGAAVPCVETYENPAISERYPGLADAAQLIGSIQIRNRASVGGNLANGSPAADSVPALIALGATAHIAGPEGERMVPVKEFVIAPGRTVLKSGELMMGLQIPPPPAYSSSAYLRFIPRNEMDIAVVGVGVALVMDGERCLKAQIALGAVGPTQIVASQAAAYLVGKRLDEAVLEHTGQLAAGAAMPIDDMRGTAEFRRHVVSVLTRRALQIAATRARLKGRAG